MSRILPALFVMIGFVASPAVALADLSKKVIAAFKGQIVVSNDPLPAGDGKDDKATIAAIKQVRLGSIKGEPNSESVTAWQFRYTAFLNKLGASALKFEFYSGKDYVADKRLEGVDPKDPVLEGEIMIDENEGPAKGKTYTVKLVAEKGRKTIVVATTTLTLN